MLYTKPALLLVMVKPRYLPYCCASLLYKAYPLEVSQPIVVLLLFVQVMVVKLLLYQVTALSSV